MRRFILSPALGILALATVVPSCDKADANTPPAADNTKKNERRVEGNAIRPHRRGPHCQGPRSAVYDSSESHSALGVFIQRNDCGGCHIEGRGDAISVGDLGAVDRGTDASGGFAKQSMLRDSQPSAIRRNRPRAMGYDPATSLELTL